MPCHYCTGTGVERLSIWLRGFWVDLAVEPEGGTWRLRVVGRERAPLAVVSLTWHAMELDFWLGRSRATWSSLEAARTVGDDVVRELRARRA